MGFALVAVAFAFLVVIHEEPALSEVEWGICFSPFIHRAQPGKFAPFSNAATRI